MNHKQSAQCIRYLLILSVFMMNLSLLAQKSREKERLLQQIAETEAEISRLQNRQESKEDNVNYCHSKVEYRQEKPMTTTEFEKFCRQNLPIITNSGSDANYTIVSSCRQSHKGMEAHFCVTTARKVVDANFHNESNKQRLVTITNTKAMYADLIESLHTELKSNGIEIIDESANLAVKHLEIKGITGSILKSRLQELKDNAFKEIKSRFGVEKNVIENENASLVDDMTNQAERLANIIPGANLVTCHYLWRILKSTPELGKVIGDAGAMVNIYFQIDEFQKKLQQLEAEERKLLNETN